MTKIYYILPTRYIFLLFLGRHCGQRCFDGVKPRGIGNRFDEINLARRCQDSEAKLIITHPSCVQTAVKAARAAGLSERCVYLFTDPLKPDKSQPGNLKPWSELWCPPHEVANWPWYKISSIEEAKSTTAILNYSSG